MPLCRVPEKASTGPVVLVGATTIMLVFVCERMWAVTPLNVTNVPSRLRPAMVTCVPSIPEFGVSEPRIGFGGMGIGYTTFGAHVSAGDKPLFTMGKSHGDQFFSSNEYTYMRTKPFKGIKIT